MLDRETLIRLLKAYKEGKSSLNKVLEKLQMLPYEKIQFARLDFHRSLRRGFPEVILGTGKSPSQLAEIFKTMAKRQNLVLATKVSDNQAEAVRESLPEVEYHKLSRMLILDRRKNKKKSGSVAVLAAGTSDLPIAEEASMTAEICGVEVERFYDIGVAGLHRLIDVIPILQKVKAVVVVAGMDGALPSIVGGLIAPPVIAVPTSVGYGSHSGGLAPLLTMLNTCVPGVAVVNIDNGFGAGYFAALIARASR